MYKQGAQSKSIQIQQPTVICLMSVFPELFFFNFILSQKNWGGGVGLLIKNGAINSYAY